MVSEFDFGVPGEGFLGAFAGQSLLEYCGCCFEGSEAGGVLDGVVGGRLDLGDWLGGGGGGKGFGVWEVVA